MDLDKGHGLLFNSRLNLKVSSATSKVSTPSLNKGKSPKKPLKHQRTASFQTNEDNLETKSTSRSITSNTEASSYIKKPFKCLSYSKDLELNFDEPLANTSIKIPTIHNDIISLTIKPLYDKVKVNRPIEVPCIISLESCNENHELIEKNRLGQDLIFVVDISGSMEGCKLDLVKTTIKFVITLLNNHDRVSIVCFNDEASIYCPLILMTCQGKEFLIQILNSIEAGSSTNIKSGIQAALHMLADRTTINQSTYILLLSDGQDSNPTNLDISIKNVFEEFKPKINRKFKFFTFGYGESHDSQVLDQIAEITGGYFYYIENESEICTTFALCMGEIMSELAGDIQVSININDCGVPFNLSCMGSDEDSNVLTMPNLLYNDKKNIVFVLSFSPINVGLAGQTIVPVVAQSTFTLINGQKVVKTAKLDINFALEKEKVTKNNEVLIEYYRVKGAECLKSVLMLADQGKFKEAKDLADLSEIEISSSDVANEPFIKNLINDIKTSKKSVESNESWVLGGRARTNSNGKKHARTKSFTTESYENETQKRYRQLSSNYMQKSYDDSEENKQDISNENSGIKQNQSIIKKPVMLQSGHTFSNQNGIKYDKSSHEEVKINIKIEKIRQAKSVDFKIKDIAKETNAAKNYVPTNCQSKNVINNLKIVKQQKTSTHPENSISSVKSKILSNLVPILNGNQKNIKFQQKATLSKK